MSELFVNRDDLESVTQTLAGMPGVPDATNALLSQLVADITAAMGELDETVITVVPAPDEVEPAPGDVEPASLIGEQFANAFEAASSAHGVHIRLHKVHR